jgi:hypothetical protein
MLPRNKSDRGALVALAIALIAVALIVWLGQPSNEKKSTQNASQIEQSNGDDVTEPVTAVREFNPWEESYAQWLMTLFSFLATGISICALFWLKRTWDQARRSADAAWKAVDETQRIGEAQVRAYLSVSDVFVRLPETRDFLEITLYLRNTGNSPASKVISEIQLNIFNSNNIKDLFK